MAHCQVKVSVIGAGHVGATFAFALLLSGMAVDVVLIDKDAGRARGEAMDLSHALPFRVPATVRAGTFEDIIDSDIVVIAAGPNQGPGETRLDLAGRNAVVMREVASEIGARCPDAILIVATNPVDVMARLAHECSGLTASRVIGSGTILDTARLKHLLGRHFGVDSRSIEAQMIGSMAILRCPYGRWRGPAAFRSNNWPRPSVSRSTTRCAPILRARCGDRHMRSSPGKAPLISRSPPAWSALSRRSWAISAACLTCAIRCDHRWRRGVRRRVVRHAAHHRSGGHLSQSDRQPVETRAGRTP
jgi:hypothetical protein